MSNDNLWEQYTKNIKPIKKNNTIIPEITTVIRKDDGTPIKIRPRKIDVVLQPRVWKGEASERWTHEKVTQLTQKNVKHKKIEGRIDLHGYTVARAEEALQRFFIWAQTSDVRFVLVITGKSGVLKEFVPTWFKSHAEYVVGFTDAQPKDGGTGAFYVHVRKMRR